MISRGTRTVRGTCRPRPIARTRRGFTVVELLLALMLLTVGMLASAAILASSTRLQRLAESRTELTAMGEAKLEELRSYGQTAATDPLRARLALGGSTTATVDQYADSLASADGVMYLRRWQVSVGIAGARLVQLRVAPRTRPLYHLPSLDFTSTVLLQ